MCMIPMTNPALKNSKQKVTATRRSMSREKGILIGAARATSGSLPLKASAKSLDLVISSEWGSRTGQLKGPEIQGILNRPKLLQSLWQKLRSSLL